MRVLALLKTRVCFKALAQSLVQLEKSILERLSEKIGVKTDAYEIGQLINLFLHYFLFNLLHVNRLSHGIEGLLRSDYLPESLNY